jgi:quercetin dioxygenase-like cupin family protein
MDVRRFGVGHRRPEGPIGSDGIEGAVVHSDGRGLIAELAFRRGGRIAPHDNPNTTWFCVVEGGGWVQVGDERRRVGAGEAVLWPAGLTHAAWTDQTTMRAFVVEFSGPDDAHVRGILEGVARRLDAGAPAAGGRGDGDLTRLDPAPPGASGPSEGEPA